MSKYWKSREGYDGNSEILTLLLFVPNSFKWPCRLLLVSLDGGVMHFQKTHKHPEDS